MEDTPLKYGLKLLLVILAVRAAPLAISSFSESFSDWMNRLSEEDIHRNIMRTKAQIGTYRLDLNKTNLGRYTDHKEEYSRLLLVLKSDSTFHINMRTPFLEDSSGKWNMGNGGPEDWNSLYWTSYDLSKYQPNVGSQFDDIDSDSTFSLVVAPMNPDNSNSKYVWFKKIK